jgi:hypothetical protein
MLRWMRWLLLRRTYPWPHRDGAGPEIIEGRSHRGAPAIVTVVVAAATRAVVLAFTLPLALTLAFAAMLGLGAGGGVAA